MRMMNEAIKFEGPDSDRFQIDRSGDDVRIRDVPLRSILSLLGALLAALVNAALLYAVLEITLAVFPTLVRTGDLLSVAGLVGGAVAITFALFFAAGFITFSSKTVWMVGGSRWMHFSLKLLQTGTDLFGWKKKKTFDLSRISAWRLVDEPTGADVKGALSPENPVTLGFVHENDFVPVFSDLSRAEANGLLAVLDEATEIAIPIEVSPHCAEQQNSNSICQAEFVFDFVEKPQRVEIERGTEEIVIRVKPANPKERAYLITAYVAGLATLGLILWLALAAIPLSLLLDGFTPFGLLSIVKSFLAFCVAIGAIYLVSMLVWTISGCEWVCVRPDRIVVGTRLFGMDRSANYRAETIRNIRFSFETTHTPRGIEYPDPEKTGNVVFDYGMKTVPCLTNLDHAQAAPIINALRSGLKAEGRIFAA